MMNHSFKENIPFFKVFESSLAGPNILSTKLGGGPCTPWLLETENRRQILSRIYVFYKTCQHNGSVCASLFCFSREIWIFMIYGFRVICRISSYNKNREFYVKETNRNISQMTKCVFRICCNKLANWKGWADTYVRNLWNWNWLFSSRYHV